MVNRRATVLCIITWPPISIVVHRIGSISALSDIEDMICAVCRTLIGGGSMMPWRGWEGGGYSVLKRVPSVV